MYNDIKISIIIATKDRIKSLNRLLHSIYNQSIHVEEVIIIDQSKCNNAEFINHPSNSTNIIYVYDPNITGLTNARNIGVSRSCGDYIFFFDDDLELKSNFVENMAKKLDKYPDIYGLCGKQIVANEKSSAYKFFRELFKKGPYSTNYDKNTIKYRYKQDEIIINTKLSGGITVYRKEIFDSFSFDENMIRYCLGEDADFSYRVSRRFNVGINAEALAHHFHDTSGRLDYKSDFAARYCFYEYFYHKNCTKKEYKYLYLIKLGLIIHAIVLSIRNSSIGPIKGVFLGSEFVKNNYINSPCIRIK